MIDKIISGGQTGADQAALDVAVSLDLNYGGAVPRGRKTENGRLPDRYVGMTEMDTPRYAPRTLQNVLDADGTLIFSHGPLTGGSGLTRQFAKKNNRPFLHVDLDRLTPMGAADTVGYWIDTKRIRILNVAGPRAGSDPEIYGAVRRVLESALSTLINRHGRTDVRHNEG